MKNLLFAISLALVAPGAQACSMFALGYSILPVESALKALSSLKDDIIFDHTVSSLEVTQQGVAITLTNLDSGKTMNVVYAIEWREDNVEGIPSCPYPVARRIK